MLDIPWNRPRGRRARAGGRDRPQSVERPSPIGSTGAGPFSPFWGQTPILGVLFGDRPPFFGEDDDEYEYEREVRFWRNRPQFLECSTALGTDFEDGEHEQEGQVLGGQTPIRGAAWPDWVNGAGPFSRFGDRPQSSTRTTTRTSRGVRF
jgi:hypothetical protein